MPPCPPRLHSVSQSPTLFLEYLNRPEDTKNSFDELGWFRTGDIAVQTKDTGLYCILGRESVDILKVTSYLKSASMCLGNHLLCCFCAWHMVGGGIQAVRT